LVIASRTQADRLTIAVTIRLGRVLIESSTTAHISCPEGTETAVTVVHNYSGELSEAARRYLEDILGKFDESIDE
jgi:hypothetical protein